MRSAVLRSHRFRLYAGLVAVALATLAVAFGPSLLASASVPPTVDKFVFTAAGDYGASPEAATTISLIGASGAKFNLAIGDLSYGEIKPEAAWCDFVREKSGGAVPFEIIPGNHEDEGANASIDALAACLPDRMSGTVGEYPEQYYFDYQGLARFIMLSPDIIHKGQRLKYKPGDQRYQWVATAIDSAHSAGIPWVIVGIHKPCLSVGRKSCEPGPDLMNLLIEKKVDLVLAGHDHNYQRSKQLALSPTCPVVRPGTFDRRCVVGDGEGGAYRKGVGSVFVTIGTGGAELYETNRNDSESGYFSTWVGSNQNMTHGFVRFVVSRDRLYGEFVRSTANSTFTDSFTLEDAAN